MGKTVGDWAEWAVPAGSGQWAEAQKVHLET